MEKKEIVEVNELVCFKKYMTPITGVLVGLNISEFPMELTPI
tara:strand:+ start:4443 stop:4568 length:126 start_codon:yes stop_codon:yes gene_type:complete